MSHDEIIAGLGAGFSVQQKVPFYESITQVVNGEGLRIRVWRSCDEMPEVADAEVLTAIGKLTDGMTMEEVVDDIKRLGRITAIEMTNSSGCGAVVYLEW